MTNKLMDIILQMNGQMQEQLAQRAAGDAVEINNRKENVKTRTASESFSSANQTRHLAITFESR